MAARLARRGALPCCAPAPGPRTQRAAALRSAGGRRRRCAAQAGARPSPGPPGRAVGRERRLIGAPAAGARQLEIHVGDTTVAFPLQDSAARELSGALVALLQTFAAKQAAERPRRWPAMEYKLPGATARAPGPPAPGGGGRAAAAAGSSTQRSRGARPCLHGGGGPSLS